MERNRWSVLGAGLLVSNAALWFVMEGISAAAWSDPSYSYASNYISDLGVPYCGTQFQGRDICSPLHTLMNTTFVAQGMLFATAIILLAGGLAGTVRPIVRTLAVLHAAGFVLVGLFHGSAEGADAALLLHVGGAAVAILCANAIVIMAGIGRFTGAPLTFRRFSVGIGALGLISEGLVGVWTSTAGAFERGGVYSWLIWGLVTGVLVMRRARVTDSPPTDGAPLLRSRQR